MVDRVLPVARLTVLESSFIFIFRAALFEGINHRRCRPREPGLCLCVDGCTSRSFEYLLHPSRSG